MPSPSSQSCSLFALLSASVSPFALFVCSVRLQRQQTIAELNTNGDVLVVTLLSGKKLAAADLNGRWFLTQAALLLTCYPVAGKSDPYCILSFGTQTAR